MPRLFFVGLIGLLLVLLAACGTFEVGIEQPTRTPAPRVSGTPYVATPTPDISTPPATAEALSTRTISPPEQAETVCVQEFTRRELPEPSKARFTLSTTEFNEYMQIMNIVSICVPPTVGAPVLGVDWNSATGTADSGRRIRITFQQDNAPGAIDITYSTYDFEVGSEYFTYATEKDYQNVESWNDDARITVNDVPGFVYIGEGLFTEVLKTYVFPFEQYYVAVTYHWAFSVDEGSEQIIRSLHAEDYPGERRPLLEAMDRLVQSLVFRTGLPTDRPVVAPAPRGIVYRAEDAVWQVDVDGQHVHHVSASDALLSRDGTQAIFADSGELWLADLTTGDKRSLTEPTDREGCCAAWWPAQSDTVLFSSWPAGAVRGDDSPSGLITGNLSAAQLDQEYQFRILDDEHDTVTVPAPSPDGSRVAYGAGSMAWMYEWDTQEVTRFDPTSFDWASPVENIRIMNPSWAPDSRSLAWVVQGQRQSEAGNETVFGVAVFDLESRSARLLHTYAPQTPIPFGMSSWYLQPRWNADGTWLAYVAAADQAREAGLWIARASGRQRQALVVGSPFAGEPPTWNPEGNRVIYTRLTPGSSDNRTTWIVDVTTWTRQKIDLPSDAIVMDWLP